MNLRDHIKPLVFDRLFQRIVSTPRGRAYILAQLADAESSDEGRIFDELLSRVDDPQLQKLIRIHQADEARHAELFERCVERTGVHRPVIPPEVRLLDRLDRALGGFFDAFLAGPRDDRSVMQTYVLLQVIEERAVTQFALLAPMFRKFDPESAQVLAEVARDEERHLKYCRAISRQYASSERELAVAVRRMRDVEARVFAENGLANMQHFLDSGMLQTAPIERFVWRAALALGRSRPRPDYTRFAAEPALA
jgi:rubrerythrin